MTTKVKIDAVISAFENGLQALETELKTTEQTRDRWQERVDYLLSEIEARKKCVEAVRELQDLMPEGQTVEIGAP